MLPSQRPTRNNHYKPKQHWWNDTRYDVWGLIAFCVICILATIAYVYPEIF